jgi:predicted esterase
MIETHNIETKTHGRYLVRRGASQRLLVGFHGYAENAEKHLAEMEKLELDWTLVSVQALHRFYTRNEEVVANWMTRQDRDDAIADNIEYVRNVVEAMKPYSTLAFIGFSQGAAMAYRAASAIACHGVLVLGGDLPPDVRSQWGGDASSPRRGDGAAAPLQILIGRGEHDGWYTDEKLKEDLKSLPRANTCVFDGGHEWSDAFRAAASEFLRRLS